MCVCMLCVCVQAVASHVYSRRRMLCVRKRSDEAGFLGSCAARILECRSEMERREVGEMSGTGGGLWTGQGGWDAPQCCGRAQGHMCMAREGVCREPASRAVHGVCTRTRRTVQTRAGDGWLVLEGLSRTRGGSPHWTKHDTETARLNIDVLICCPSIHFF